MFILIRWLINALMLIVVAQIVDGVSFSSFFSALIAAAILGLVNILVKPILTILTLPITILTFGLFSLVINALMLLLTSSIVRGFDVAGLWPALLAALILWLLNVVIDQFGSRYNQPTQNA